HLHEHASTWSDDALAERPSWDAAGLASAAGHWGDVLQTPDLTASERALLDEVREVVAARLRDWRDMPGAFTLIHADLHMGNVVFEDGQAHALDFDDCGLGYVMYDAAVTTHGDPDRFAAWLEGYRSVRPLDDALVDTWDTFVMARALTGLAWVASRSDNPGVAKHLDRARSRTLAAAERFV